MSARACLYAAVPTPVDTHFRVSVSPLAEHCQSLLADGCHGLVLFGTTGEGTFFSAAEKISAVESLIAAGIDAARIVVASGTCALGDAVSVICGAHELGCRGSLVLPPFFMRPVVDEGLGEWIQSLIARSGLGSVYLYHIPGITGVGFSASLMHRLLERYDGRLVGVKDSTADSSLARALGARGHSGIFVSTEVDLATATRAGISGTMSASLNLTLPLVLRALAGDQAAGNAVTALRSHLASASLIWAVKVALASRTGDPIWRRLVPPHCPPPDADETGFLARLRDLSSGMAG